MKLIVGRILSAFLTAGGWLLVGVRLVLDLIGYSTIPEDVSVAKGRLDQFFELVLSAPWWSVWGFALVTTLWLIWVSWPRQSNDAAKGALEQQPLNSIEQQPTRHFSKSDKDRISEMFFEMTEMLAKQAWPIESEGQQILQTWGDPGHIQTAGLLIERLLKVEENGASFQSAFFMGIRQKYPREKDLFNIAVGPATGGPIGGFRDEAKNFRIQLERVLAISKDGEQYAEHLVGMMRATVDTYRNATSRLNDWIDQTQKRIRQQENEILGR